MLQDELTITLSKPITIGAGDAALVYEKLELREPTAGELEKASRADTSVGVAINLIQMIAKIPRAAAEKIGQRDLARANEFFGAFTSGQSAAEAGQS
ncbi:Phage tail assembly chaperone protein, E, or 41 or 14 [Azotobacter beijerinckii]|uniref:Phage tail assembly chaperone protein, E, or 41 or 14 n=1 Tax=Azotobacter beijerinckii TaxID=170623 RepID=A0A1H6X0N5_9GAMM|nr:phage tail assembly protein [Azotobacter beijerinckii]SEJ21686.1 Phage tail assembly chaperone protein, E, or 41 or 14 [Azotobacter beijerinckii]